MDLGAESNYDTNKFTLKLNNNFSRQEFQEYVNNNYNKCFTSSDNLKYDFYVGLGEFLAFKYNPYAYTINTRVNNFSDAFLKVASKLGANAGINFSRFNSTYIASRMCGIKFAKSVDDEYAYQARVELKFPA